MTEVSQISSDNGKNAQTEDSGRNEIVGMHRAEAPCPLLLEEGSDTEVPAHVSRVLASIQQEIVQAEGEASPADLLVGLLYVLAVEAGFLPPGSPGPGPGPLASTLRGLARLPGGWRRPDRYELHFGLAALSQSEPPCRLVALPSDDLLIVTLVASAMAGASASHSFRPVDFVSPPSSAVRRRGELAHTFKDRVCLPVKAALFNARGLLNPSLLGLPGEMKLAVAYRLRSASDLLHLGLCCSGLAPLLSDGRVWRSLLRRHFPEEFRQLEERREREQVDWRRELRALRERERERQASARRPYPWLHPRPRHYPALLPLHLSY